MDTLMVEEPFLIYYQLDHDPFAPRVPDFKFFPAQRKGTLAQLHHLARHGDLMLVVIGPHESGKTLLRQAFMASTHKETTRIVSLSALNCPEAADILQPLAQELKAEVSPVDILKKIENLHQLGHTLYLIIDDADQLDVDVLEVLLNFANEKLPALRIFLFGQPSLSTLLDNSSIGKELSFILPLTPYTFEEAKEYMSIRLEGAGQSLELFTDEQLEQIYQQSGGWPGVINQVAKDYLLDTMEVRPSGRGSRKRKKLSFKLPSFKLSKKQGIVGGVVIACAVILLAVMNHSTKSPDQVAVVDDKNVPVAEVQTQTQTIALSDTGVDGTPITRQPLEKVVSDEHQGELGLDDSVPRPDNMPLPTVNRTPETVATQSASQVQTMETSPSAPVTAAPVVTAATTSTPVAKHEPTPRPAVVKANTSTAESKTTSAAKVKPVEKVTAANTWYAKQSAAYYTLQVSVVGSEKAAKEVLTHGSEYHYYKRTRSGKVDYVVTYGSFASKAQAQQAMKKLPTAVQRSKPWPRTFAGIKKEMAK